MKKTGLNLLSLLFIVIMAGVFNTCLIAQSVPMGINYQAVARDANGDELVNRNIDVRLSIISGSPTGEVEFEEVHSEVTTSQFGLFNIVIGQGIYSNGTVTSFEDILWGDNLHFLKVEIKFDSEYLTMGTMQFLSVPYALYAQKSLEPGPQGLQGPAGDPATDDQVLSYDPQSHILSLENDDNPVDLSGLINDADADTDNELQILNLSGNKLQIKTLSDSTLINSVDIDASTVNEIQNLSIQGRQLSLSLGNSVSLPDSVKDDDADPLNEIQDLHIEGNVLYITRNSDSTRIDFSPYLDNTDEQYLSLTQNLLSIENGSTVALNYNDTSAINELQVLSISNDTIYLSNGGKVFLGGYLDNTDQQDLSLSDNLLSIENGNTVALNYNDTSATNELQVLSISNDTIYLSNGGKVYLGGYIDNTDQQDLSLSDNMLTIDNGNTVALNYNDTSATNELQVLSISNDTIYLTNGGYVKLPPDNVNDADADPGNELITGVNLDGANNLEITDAGGTTTVDLSSLENIPLIGFRAIKDTTTNHTSIPDSLFLIFEDEIYDYGEMYNETTGEFTSPEEGVYSFVINYNADESQVIKLFINGAYFDTYYGNEVNSFSGYITSNILVYLNAGDVLRLKIYIYGYDTDCGKGSITGFRIH